MFWPESPIDYEFYIAEAKREDEEETARHEAHMRDLGERRKKVCQKTARTLAEHWAGRALRRYDRSCVSMLYSDGSPMMGTETVWLCDEGRERTDVDIRDEMEEWVKKHRPELTERLDVFVLVKEALEIFKRIAP